jgi:hydrogenase large subunit
MDPVTRIEGHMKVEVRIDQNKIVDAHCTGTLFRGFETLLKGRKPIDATVITQRICGVCPISHGQASVLALENVSEWLPPKNARLLRNLTLGANYIQSHILHFYLLAALDYAAGPQASPWEPAWKVDIRPGAEAVAANLAAALEARRQAHEMGAVFGGKMPSSHAFVPGGFTATPTTEEINSFRAYLNSLINFIRNTYIPDVQALGKLYPEYLKIGAGCENLLAYGVFEMDDINQEKLLSAGYIEKGSTQALDNFNSQDITESVQYSWYEDGTNNLTPADGDTRPLHPKAEAYSWLKSPRLYGKPFETGPLARMKVNGDYQGGISVMDRHLARSYEALKVGETMTAWLNQLDGGPSYDDYFEQYSGFGIGMTEAPRGALGHWVRITNGEIAQYQVITPTCWNASPRDDQSVPGPMEQALIGTPVENPAQPIEALRVIHSFDPCLSCAVHIMQPDGRPQVVYAGSN